MRKNCLCNILAKILSNVLSGHKAAICFPSLELWKVKKKSFAMIFNCVSADEGTINNRPIKRFIYTKDDYLRDYAVF